MSAGVCVLLLALFGHTGARGQPLPQLVIDPPKPIVPSVGAPVIMALGFACHDNFTCTPIANSHCADGECRCLPSFFEDSNFPGMCKPAPGYGELCDVDANAENSCRAPFACNASAQCDCPQGYLQEYYQCIRDCPTNQVPSKERCLEARALGEMCEEDEQCTNAYAQCLHRKCQCIAGANQFDGNCYPVNQCPLGDPILDANGKILECSAMVKDSCPKDYYCLYAQSSNAAGFCCPKIRMNCPIGSALVGHNCTNCPWHTHHCFSYVIGTYTESMCCPNACQTSQPIQRDGHCYSRAAFGGRCELDEQCASVSNAVCRADDDDAAADERRCRCPVGNYRHYFDRCIKVATLGESCDLPEECRAGTNTVCETGVCSCYPGYIAEPQRDANATQADKCIAEPSCPTAGGISTMSGAYVDCSDDASVCAKEQFCRKWWFDGNNTFSLCCAKPSLHDYESICAPFRMNLVLSNAVAPDGGAGAVDAAPLRCYITPPPRNVWQDAATNGTQPLVCPDGSSCLFDPYGSDSGVCCRLPTGFVDQKPTKHVQNRRLNRLTV